MNEDQIRAKVLELFPGNPSTVYTDEDGNIAISVDKGFICLTADKDGSVPESVFNSNLADFQ